MTDTEDGGRLHESVWLHPPASVKGDEELFIDRETMRYEVRAPDGSVVCSGEVKTTPWSHP